MEATQLAVIVCGEGVRVSEASTVGEGEGACATTQNVAPAVLDVPAAQGAQVALKVAPVAADQVPAGQGVQVALEAAPVAAEKVPALQLVKLTLPQPLQKAPAGQTMGAVAGQKKPGLHGQRLATCAAFRVAPHSFNSSSVAVMDMKVGDVVEPT
jgi:hypothetical protein